MVMRLSDGDTGGMDFREARVRHAFSGKITACISDMNADPYLL